MFFLCIIRPLDTVAFLIGFYVGKQVSDHVNLRALRVYVARERESSKVSNNTESFDLLFIDKITTRKRNAKSLQFLFDRIERIVTRKLYAYVRTGLYLF